jgi:hypothetical protein
MGREVEFGLGYIVEGAINMCNSRKGQDPLCRTSIDVPYEVIVFYFETKVRVFYSIFEDAFKST